MPRGPGRATLRDSGASGTIPDISGQSWLKFRNKQQKGQKQFGPIETCLKNSEQVLGNFQQVEPISTNFEKSWAISKKVRNAQNSF
jgi:hypothetical protein